MSEEHGNLRQATEQDYVHWPAASWCPFELKSAEGQGLSSYPPDRLDWEELWIAHECAKLRFSLDELVEELMARTLGMPDLVVWGGDTDNRENEERI